MATSSHTTLTVAEALVVIAICFGLPILTSVDALFNTYPDAPLTDAGAIGLILVEAILSGGALLFLKARGFALGTLIPRPTLRDSLVAALVMLSAWLIGFVVTAPLPTQPTQALDSTLVASSVSMVVMVALACINSAFEEVFLLGVLMRGLRGFGLSVAIGVPLLVRVLYSLYQGPINVVWVLVFGLCFSLAYARKQALWTPVLAHFLWDISTLATALP
jgi:membrane protease YdiL (CAAX protease family)